MIGLIEDPTHPCPVCGQRCDCAIGELYVDDCSHCDDCEHCDGWMDDDQPLDIEDQDGRYDEEANW